MEVEKEEEEGFICYQEWMGRWDGWEVDGGGGRWMIPSWCVGCGLCIRAAHTHMACFCERAVGEVGCLPVTCCPTCLPLLASVAFILSPCLFASLVPIVHFRSLARFRYSIWLLLHLSTPSASSPSASGFTSFKTSLQLPNSNTFQRDIPHHQRLALAITLQKIPPNRWHLPSMRCSWSASPNVAARPTSHHRPPGCRSP